MTEEFCVHANEVCREAVDTFGWEKQSLIAVEEMSELTKEIIKRHRGLANFMHIAEEIADVQVMLLQLVYMFDLEERVEQSLRFKIERLKTKLEGRA